MDIIFTIISVICFVHSFLVFIDVERDFLHSLVHCFLDYLLEYFILINLHVRYIINTNYKEKTKQ